MERNDNDILQMEQALVKAKANSLKFAEEKARLEEENKKA